MGRCGDRETRGRGGRNAGSGTRANGDGVRGAGYGCEATVWREAGDGAAWSWSWNKPLQTANQDWGSRWRKTGSLGNRHAWVGEGAGA